MDVTSLKKYLYENNKVEDVLFSLGCHKVKYNKGKEYYSAAHKDGDNPSGIIIYNNKYLNYISYSRNVTYEDRQDIVNLVQTSKSIDFVSAIKWLHEIGGIEYTSYKASDNKKKSKKDPLDVFKRIRERRYKINVDDIHEIDEEAINDFVPLLHYSWYKEGIMPWTRKKFGLCYSYKHNRMVIPLRYWATGDLLGFNQRTMVENYKELGIPKYYLNNSYQKNLNLYGLWENKDEIENAEYVVVAESEKSVLKRDSLNDGTCVALQGKVMSEEQRRIILGLDIKEVIIALDKDVDINEVRSICEKFYRLRKVSYIYDKWGLLEDKQAPMDARNKVYNFIMKHRVVYDESEHQKYLQSLKM